jgi:hypothetical protein
MHAVAQVPDLVVALDELLAQPLDLLHGVTNKLGIVRMPIRPLRWARLARSARRALFWSFPWVTGAVSRKVFFALGSGRSAPYRLGLNIHSDLLQLFLNL